MHWSADSAPIGDTEGRGRVDAVGDRCRPEYCRDRQLIIGREISLDLGGQSEHHVTDGLLVIIFPIFDLVLICRDLFFRRGLVSSECDSPAIQSDVSGARSGEYVPLALQHEEALHGDGPGLVVRAGEDGDKSSEAGRHVSC